MKALIAFLLVCVTLVSAAFDAQGFVWASRAWNRGILDMAAAARSLGWFGAGVSIYIGSIWLHQKLGISDAALQSVFWFAMTVVGIAVIDGSLSRWTAIQIVIALGVTVGIAWLLWSAPH